MTSTCDGRDRLSRGDSSGAARMRWVSLLVTIGGNVFSNHAARARKGLRLVGDGELLEALDTMREEEEEGR